MKARKLPSGRWNIQVYIGTDDKGKRKYKSITEDTKKEAEKKAAAIDSSPRHMTILAMVNDYIEAKRPVLSPNTYRGYKGIVKGGFEGTLFADLPIGVVRNTDVQRWISKASLTASPKTVKNYYGLFSAALAFYFPEKVFRVKLPQAKPTPLYTPTTAEIKTLLEAAKERNYELYKAILLGAVGMMRQGEIAALTADDIDFEAHSVRISKSQAYVGENNFVIKQPKTYSSVRTIFLPQFVLDALPKSGQIVKLNVMQISSYFQKLMDKTDLPHFRFHDLRHYAASIAASSSVGASAASIRQRGGWASDSVMKRVYINQLTDEVQKDNQNLNTFFEEQFNEK